MSDEEYLAIDFVLIPSGQTWKQAIQWNRQFCDARIKLGFRMTPHLSLLMCYIKKSSLYEVLNLRNLLFPPKILLNDSGVISNSFSRFSLEGLRLNTKELTCGNPEKNNPILSWGIERTDLLTQIQESLIQNFQIYFQSPTPTQIEKSFFGVVEESTYQWTGDYIEKSTGANFDPHITIGFWDSLVPLPQVNSSIASWQMDSYPIGIFQLGNYCTCRNRLKLNPSLNLYSCYMNSKYLLDDYSKEEIRIGYKHPYLDTIMEQNGVSSWAFITGWNPYSHNLSSIDNQNRNNELLAIIEEEGWKYLTGRGEGFDKYNPGIWSEQSFLILGITKEDAYRLSSFMEQNSFVFSNIYDIAELIV